MTTTTPSQSSPRHTIESLASASENPRWIWRGGRLMPWAEATVHVNAVGHASVSSVFEGIKAYLAQDGQRLVVFRLDDHLRRLYGSARICRLGLSYGPAVLRQAIVDLLVANDCRVDTYVRPWAFPCGLIREQLQPAGVECELVVDTWPFRSTLSSASAGCRAAVSSWLRTGDASAPPRAKAFSNYHNGRFAVMEARENGHDWPIMLNGRHQVSEGPGACIALVRDGVVITPSLTSGLLESITRDTVLALLGEHGVAVREREIDRTELYIADEVFFMGTGWEILPVLAVDGLAVGTGTPGPVTLMLRDEYARIVRGASPRHTAWLTEVPIGRAA